MPDPSQATREIMWNIGPAWLMYVLAVASGVALVAGMAMRIREWRKGKPAGERLADWGTRLWILAREVLFQKRVRSSPLPGLFHGLIFYSFIVLVITTGVVAMDYDFHTTLFRGWTYVILSVAAEAAGVFLLIGVGIAAWRRYVSRPKTIETTAGDTIALALLAVIVVTGFLAEGLRIAVAGDEWKALSPVGWALGLAFAGVGYRAGGILHQVFWWTHAVAAFGWIASIPYWKFVHMLALPGNVFFSKLEPRGALQRVDIEKLMEADEAGKGEFHVGIEKTGDFTWKQRLDLAACIGCGRCEEVCPATLAGQPFSPRRLVSESKRLSSGGNGANGGTAIVGNAFDEDFIWFCRTCTACMEVCPAAIDHVDTLLEIRRNEVLMQGRVPGEASRALRAIENQGNPFGVQNDRLKWVESLGLKVIGPGEECDVIYWIGCCTTYDPAKQSIASDLCELLRRCGIEFGVLGADERCCGDPARVLGDERLFQDTAKAQVEAIRQRKFKVLLVSCPHCYNVLKNEYRQFGGDFNVVHHSEFLHEMLWAGELVPSRGEKRRIVYHDPCYLGRYQKVYDAPRQVLRALPGAELVEMKSHHEKSMCCGGGGGHYWMDLKRGERINNLRVRQADAAGADTIVTGCAYCRQMLDDSVKLVELDDRIKVVDIVSIMLRSLPPAADDADRPWMREAEPADGAGAGGEDGPSDAAPRVCG